jgi:hypothetical protein
MIYGFTGSRKGMTDQQEVMFEGLISGIKKFIHGSCTGSDVQAARIVRKTFKTHIPIHAYPGPEDDPCREDSRVDDFVAEPMTHFARNRKIVQDCQELIATPAEMTEQATGGTWYTIRYARKIGRKVTIIWPDGSLGPD